MLQKIREYIKKNKIKGKVSSDIDSIAIEGIIQADYDKLVIDLGVSLSTYYTDCKIALIYNK